MTNFEKIKSMSIEEFSEWLDKYGSFDGSPWMDWFSKKYCNNCENIMVKYPNKSGVRCGKEFPCSYCELNGNCRFFQDLEETPNNEEIIKMWLGNE